MSSPLTQRDALQAIVLDFDGVVVESTDLKTAAFRALFADHPDKLDAIVDYHTANLGISRYVKFRHIYQEILGRRFDEAVERRLGDRFSRLVAAEVARCSFVPGAMEFMRAYSQRLPLFVASGTPEPELRNLLAGRGLTGYFRGTYGSPATKPAILEGIARSLGVQTSSLLFVGDGRSDCDAARATNAGFVGRVRAGDPNPFQDVGVPVIEDLVELASHIDACLSTPVRGRSHASREAL